MQASARRREVAAGARRWQRAPALAPSTSPPSPDAALLLELERDRACVKRLAGGDRGALRELYDRYARRVQALGLHLLRDAGEAEDLVQETFVDVWRRREEYDAARGSVLSWVLVIARSRALTRLRAQKSAQRRDDEVAREGADEVQAPTALRAVEAREAQSQVSAALATLPPEQRQALELAYFEGLSQSEIAERTQEPLGTVKTRVRLGMQKMARLLLGGEGR